VAVFQLLLNQGVAAISLTLKMYAREGLKQQNHEMQSKATTGEKIKWGTNWVIYKSETKNASISKVYYCYQ
jgi:hypothetical protein